MDYFKDTLKPVEKVLRDAKIPRAQVHEVFEFLHVSRSLQKCLDCFGGWLDTDSKDSGTIVKLL